MKCSEEGCKEQSLENLEYCKPHYILNRRKTKYPEFFTKKNIPPIYKKATFEDFPEELIESVSNNKSLFIYGNSGTGKTHLAAALMHNDYVNRNEYEIEFTSLVTLLQKLRASFKANAEESEEDIVERYKTIKHLYIDDIGVEKVTDWMLMTLYSIIDHRYSWELRTVFTSNLTISQLKDKLGERIASRIKGMCEVLKLEGQDLRGEKK